MDKNFKQLLAAAAVATALAPVSASAFMLNWQFDPDGPGPGGSFTVNEYLDYIGNSYTQNSLSGSSFTFTDNGTFAVTGVDGTLWNPSYNQITAVLSGATGSGTLGGSIAFDPGATLNLYSDAVYNYASTTGIYGANDGTNFATLTLVSGSALVDTSGLPNGMLSLVFQFTNLLPGYLFDQNGNDLSTIVPHIPPILFGFTTSNASYVSNPSTNVKNEIVGELSCGGDPTCGGTYTNTPPYDFVVSNNGQFRIPEPASLALVGAGLLAFGLRRRKARS